MPRKGEDFEKFSQNWQRDPRAADLDYLDLVFPQHKYHSFASITLPCFHKVSTADNHSLGKVRSTDPIFNTFTDLHLTNLHNLSIFYDRFQTFAKFCEEKFGTLEAKLAELEKEAVAPKSVEAETLKILQHLEDRITKLEAQQLS